MIRLKRMQPGKFYHVKRDGSKIQVVRIDPPAPNRFGIVGGLFPEFFKKKELFMYVESRNALEYLNFGDYMMQKNF